MFRLELLHCTLLISSVELRTFQILQKLSGKQIVICDTACSVYYIQFFSPELTCYTLEDEGSTFLECHIL
jgi:hypothetical protein